MTTTTTTAIELQHRFVQIEGSKDKSDTLEFSFSSEEPVQRYFGDEVLDHDEKSVDLTRLNSGVAPLLFNHNQDAVIGVVTRAWIQDRKGRAEIRWAENPKAKEVRADVENNILRGISVGYTINKAEQEGEITRAVSWFPHELSVVSIPADFKSIGIGRTLPPSQPSTSKKEMSYVMDGVLPEQNQGEFETECRNFSIIKAAQASISGNWSQAAREREINEELSARAGRSSSGFFVPDAGWQKRAYVTSSGTAGGNLVETQILSDSFIDALRKRLAVTELGATLLTGNVGNLSIPKRTGSSTAYWFGGDNADSITESTGTIGTVSLTPKSVAAYSKFSHLMKLQATPDIENLIRNDFISIVAEAIDAACISGSGCSSQPLGILNTTGIGSVSGGTNGLAPTLDHMIDLKKAVAVDSADSASAGFLTNSKVEAALAKLKDDQNNYLLSPYGSEVGTSRLCGRKMVISENVPSNLTKGSGSNLSAILYGNFQDLIIATWGTLEVETDISTDFAKGTTGIRVIQSVDCGVRHSESFSAMVDAIAA